MDMKLRQIAALLNRYDSDLFPKRYLDGSMGIMRKIRRYDFHRFDEYGFVLWFAKDIDDLILPITHNWLPEGTPVDWGIEPILSKIQETDAWRDDGEYERFCKKRAERKESKKKADKNEFRALAADCRKDFAKATNEINTSNLETVERRRIHDGYRR